VAFDLAKRRVAIERTDADGLQSRIGATSGRRRQFRATGARDRKYRHARRWLAAAGATELGVVPANCCSSA
jgi:hypothetical protein